LGEENLPMTESNILIVEDERIVAKDIEQRLKELKYNVTGIVTTGEKALEKVEELHPDLVFMDIRLRGAMDGIEAAEAIKRRFDIPVIYLTAYADEATLERAKITEPFGYILKPFNERDLYSTVEMALYKHKMEKTLRENKEWFSTTLRSIGEGVIATDVKGTIIFMNPVAEDLLGLKQEDFIGKNLTELCVIDKEGSHDIQENQVQRAITEGKRMNFVDYSCLIAKDSRRIPIDSSVAPIRGRRGETTGAVLTFRDVSERKQFESQIKHSQGMKILGQLAAGVAHEVRNPLNAILAITEALFQDIGDNKEYQPYLEHIRTQVNRLSELMKDLLELGKPIQSSQLKSELLEDLCMRSLDLWKQTLLSRICPVTFTSHVGPDKVYVMVDASRLQQVFLNLLENASQHCIEGTDVRLTILEPENNMVCVQIIDGGAGIPNDKLEKVFEPFFTARRGGVGLGLSIVKHSIESMGGTTRIWNNDPPPGCTVEVMLPVVREE
jgi:two-component system cell cycle sensor histidine kinase/response regulator CckA